MHSRAFGWRGCQPGRNLVPVYLRMLNPRRSRDAGGNWASKIKSAKSAGHDGIVYLNRYEGIPYEAIERATMRLAGELAVNPSQALLDALPDEQFRKYVPEAQDSYIAFSAGQIKSAIDCRARATSEPRPRVRRP